jgi:hypothetical protein
MTQMLAEVREPIDEQTALFYTDIELRRWIMEGARDIARRAEVLLARATIVAIAGVREYGLPAATVRVHRAEWIPDPASATPQVYPLEFRDYAAMDGVWGTGSHSQQGHPACFTFWGFAPDVRLIVFPIPPQAGEITAYTYRLPTDIATDGTQDANTVECPEGWHDLIRLFCEYTAFRKDGDQRWVDAKTIYEERLAEMIEVTRRHSDQGGSIQTVSGSWLPAWLVGDY